MTNLELKNYIAAMLQREPSDLVYDSVDVLQNSVNNALLRAQRLVNFNLALSRGYLPLTDGTASWRNDMLNAKGGTSVSVKKVKSFYQEETFQNELLYFKESDNARLAKGSGGVYLYVAGSELYLMNKVTPLEGLYCVYYKQLEPLSDDTDTNFLTENISDWIVFQCIFELQFFLKEDERVQLSTGILADKWNSVLTWNASMHDEMDLSLD